MGGRLAAALVVAAILAGAAPAADDGKPLPFERTTILPSGGTFHVTIDKSAKIQAEVISAIASLSR